MQLHIVHLQTSLITSVASASLRAHAAAVSANNVLYISGGYTKDGYSNRLLRFDPQVNQWEQMASMSRDRGGHGERGDTWPAVCVVSVGASVSSYASVSTYLLSSSTF